MNLSKNLRKSWACVVLLTVAYVLSACTSTAPRPGGPVSGSSVPNTSVPNTSTPGTTVPATPQPGAQSNTEGLVKEYDVTPEAAWEIAKTVFRWEGAGAIQEQRSKGYMLTSLGANALSSGTVMGAWIEPGKQAQTSKVTILTKRNFLSSASTLTESAFHKRFAQALTMVKQGKTLPKIAPPMPA